MTPDAFVGRWHLSRRIDDRRAGQIGHFEGHAVIGPDAKAPGLVYDEDGLLHLPGQSALRATRRYLWRPDAEGFDVYFEDNRYFHRLPLQGGAAAHWCDPDQYDVHYDLTTWPNWSSTWHVVGPRKSYIMTSHYSRST